MSIGDSVFARRAGTRPFPLSRERPPLCMGLINAVCICTFGERSAILQSDVIAALRNALIGRTNNLTDIDLLLKQVCAPARDTGHGKHRSEQLCRQTQHMIHKAAVLIDVRTEALVKAALLANHLRGKTLDERVQTVLLLHIFLLGQSLHERLEDIGTRIGN